MPDVACVGILVADVVGKPVDKWPERGKLQLVDRMELHSGGCAANVGVALAKIGFDAAVIGKVGDDGFGDFMVRALEWHGVDASGVIRDERAATSATMVMVDSRGERTFVHYLGANAEFKESDINLDIVLQSRVIHIAGALLMPKIDGLGTANVLKRAREAGITTALDTAWDATGHWMAAIAPCLPYVDYLLPSIEEARMVTGLQEPRDVAQALLDAGVKVVGLKMGAEGCYVKTAATELRLPPFEVEAVDAVGAGDCFVAGFLTGVLSRWDLERTGRFANAVGALCVTALGATTGVRTLEDTLDFMSR